MRREIKKQRRCGGILSENPIRTGAAFLLLKTMTCARSMQVIVLPCVLIAHRAENSTFPVPGALLFCCSSGSGTRRKNYARIRVAARCLVLGGGTARVLLLLPPGALLLLPPGRLLLFPPGVPLLFPPDVLLLLPPGVPLLFPPGNYRRPAYYYCSPAHLCRPEHYCCYFRRFPGTGARIISVCTLGSRTAALRRTRSYNTASRLFLRRPAGSALALSGREYHISLGIRLLLHRFTRIFRRLGFTCSQTAMLIFHRFPGVTGAVLLCFFLFPPPL